LSSQGDQGKTIKLQSQALRERDLPVSIEGLVEAGRYEELGYRPLVLSDGWQVAVLRLPSGFLVPIYERHLKTDEVFVLTEGEATLIIGGRAGSPEGLEAVRLERNVVYNVLKGVWHAIVSFGKNTVLIVENRDTHLGDFERQPFSEAQKAEAERKLGINLAAQRAELERMMKTLPPEQRAQLEAALRSL